MKLEFDYEAPPVWIFLVAMVVAFAVSYFVGYLLIDVLKFVALPASSSQDGAIHGYRGVVGGGLIAVIGAS